MEFNLKKVPIGSLSTIMDTVAQQNVDIDFTLPDYCPDIEKILRCKITPKIYNRNLSGGQLQVDGTTVVTILYVDSQNNNLRACEQSVPFNASFQLKDAPEAYIIETDVKTEFVNCRALSQRRLAVHGAFSLHAKVFTRGSALLYSPEQSDELEFKTEEISACALCAFCQEQFSAGDEIQITNKPPVEVILDSDVKAYITDYKIIPQKLMLNGELSVRMLYLSNAETGEPCRMDCVIPFSRIIDCEGLKEDVTTRVTLSVLSFDLRLKSDILSENPVVDVEARLSAWALGYESVKKPAVFDAYSTRCRAEAKVTPVSLCADTRVIRDSFMQKDNLSIGDAAVSSIIDISTDYSSLSPVITETGVTLNSKMNLCVLALDGDNIPIYMERTADFSKEIQLEPGFNRINDASSYVASISYRIGENNTLELRSEIKYTLTVSQGVSYSLVSSVNINEDMPVEKKDWALTLYFARKGERLWDIAKEYKAPLQLLLKENDAEGDVLNDDKMILIPTA